MVASQVPSFHPTSIFPDSPSPLNQMPHGHLPLFSPHHSAYLETRPEAQQPWRLTNSPRQLRPRVHVSHLFPPTPSARLQDWVVYISPLSDWLFRFWSSWRWGVNPFTANQGLPLPKPHPLHAARAVNPPVERGGRTLDSESTFYGRRIKERKKLKVSAESGTLRAAPQ